VPLGKATIGAANAGAAAPLTPVALPLEPGGLLERGALESLLVRARERGVVGARLFGHAAAPPPHAADAAHAAAGVVAFTAAALGLEAGLWALGAGVVSCALGAAELPCLGSLLPRRPSWSLLLRPVGAGTRRLVVAPTDRARLLPRLSLFVLGAHGVALLSLVGPLPVRVLGAVALASVGAVAAWLGRAPRAEADGPETIAARALLRYADLEHDPSVAVVLAGCSSAGGDGIASVLDWWGVPKGQVAIDLVVVPGAAPPPAAAALSAAGWAVRTISPEALRSPP
jgi:hypothetical protein